VLFGRYFVECDSVSKSIEAYCSILDKTVASPSGRMDLSNSRDGVKRI
jgi:hypothetical protein